VWCWAPGNAGSAFSVRSGLSKQLHSRFRIAHTAWLLMSDGENLGMHNEIGPAVLGLLSVVFAAYGVRELALAYRVVAVKDWGEKAVQGAAGVCVAVVFAVMTWQILN
jgi:hypothetical protein